MHALPTEPIRRRAQILIGRPAILPLFFAHGRHRLRPGQPWWGGGEKRKWVLRAAVLHRPPLHSHRRIIPLSTLTAASALGQPSEGLGSSPEPPSCPCPARRTCTCTSPSTSTLQTSMPHQRSSGSSTTSCMATGLAARTQTAATSTSPSSTFHRWGQLPGSGSRAALLALEGLFLEPAPGLQPELGL